MAVREAMKADELVKDAWGGVIPSLRPHNPPIRAWDFCGGCWENDMRAIHKLKGTDV